MVPNITTMPVSAPCESTISSAIQNSLLTTTNTSAYSNNNTNGTNLNSQVIGSVKRGLLTKIEYEEAPPNLGNSIHENLKSKYTFLDGSVPTPNKDLQSQPTTVSQSSCTTSSSSFSNKDGPQIPAPTIVLFPRENVQIGWKSTGQKWQIGAGMINVGNTCYLNSTLQALFHVPSFANWLLSDVEENHRESCENNSGSQGGCIICAMAKTLIASQKNQQPFKPLLVYSKLRLVCRRLIPGHQEDAHEFLRYLMEAMEKAYLARYKNINTKCNQYTNETTPINQILGGYLKSSVRCLTCGHVSVTFQHFEDLLLDIRKANSIEEALDVHFARERLEDMGYKCEACKKKVSATKQFSLERPPAALCIQLKRFSMMGGKLNKQVTIKQKLDLSLYSSKKTTESLNYRLVAMVTHLGASQHCGHYTAIGLHDSGVYYQFDDSCVRPIPLQNVLNTNAYIIFYELENDCNTNVTSSASIKYGNSCLSGNSTITSKFSSSAISIANDLNKKHNNNDNENDNDNGQENNRHHKSLFGDVLTNCDTTKTNRFIGPVLPPQQQQQQQNRDRLTSLSLNGNGNGNINGSNINQNLGSKLVNNSNKMLNGHGTTNGNMLNKNVGNRPILTSPSSSSINRFKTNTPSPSPKKDDTTIHFNRLNGNSKKPTTLNFNNNEKKSESLLLASSTKCPTSPTLPSMPNLDSLSSCTTNNNNNKISNGSSSSICNNNSQTKLCTPTHKFNLSENESSSIKQNSTNAVMLNNKSNNSKIATLNTEKPKSLVPYTLDDGDDSDSNSTHNSCTNYLSSSSSSAPSTLITTKAGVWQVSPYNNNISTTSSKTDTTSPALTAVKNTNTFNCTTNNNNNNKFLSNGHRNGNANNLKRSSSDSTVNKLQKMSHMGYGASVKSWNGQASRLNNEVTNEKQEERTRAYENLDDMDRGRIKKFKSHNNNNFSRDNPGYNPFNEHQIQSNNRHSNNNLWNNHRNNNNNRRTFNNYRQNSYHGKASFRGNRMHRNSFPYQRGNNDNRFNRRSTH